LPADASNSNPSSTVSVPGQWCVYFLVLGLTIVCEGLRWADPQSRLEALTGWLAGSNADWLPFLPWLLLAPLFLKIGRGRSGNPFNAARKAWLDQSAASSQGRIGTWMAAGLLFLLAFLASRWAGWDLHGFPPAYHDEYSYLFQAQTYLQGRWWLPSSPTHPEWFDQMHVLNEGHFASRYFPGVGFWLAPFVALGHPWLGYQLAQGLSAVLVFCIGRELSTNRTGVLAGVLFSLSPGLLLFSNLLLAHHPGMLGLLLFAWTFFRWMRCGGVLLLFVSGCGLSFAMLCRPMTAAGFGLPFGILFAIWWLTGKTHLAWERNRNQSLTFQSRTLFAIVLAAPLLFGLLISAVSNQAITGSWWKSPYQLYTDIYTPRHRYGFNNVIKGEERLGPKVLDHYDRWAENLTPNLAAQNVKTRLESSLRWSMGIVPLLLGGMACLFSPQRGDPRWKLIWYSVLSLHVVHLPYWFAGIMGWHYVFESAPLWILLFAEGTRRLVQTWQQTGCSGLRWWWNGLILLSLAVNLITLPPIWPGRIEQGMAELAFPRSRYHRFREQVDMLRQGENAIVLVLPDAADRHMDYVTNLPTLDGPVIVARIRNRNQLQQAAAAFPDRVPIVFDAARQEMSRLHVPPPD